jgi:hypothetical protein
MLLAICFGKHSKAPGLVGSKHIHVLGHVQTPEVFGSKHIHELGISPELQICLVLTIFTLWDTSRPPGMLGSKHIHALGPTPLLQNCLVLSIFIIWEALQSSRTVWF